MAVNGGSEEAAGRCSCTLRALPRSRCSHCGDGQSRARGRVGGRPPTGACARSRRGQVGTPALTGQSRRGTGQGPWAANRPLRTAAAGGPAQTSNRALPQAAAGRQNLCVGAETPNGSRPLRKRPEWTSPINVHTRRDLKQAPTKSLPLDARLAPRPPRLPPSHPPRLPPIRPLPTTAAVPSIHVETAAATSIHDRPRLHRPPRSPPQSPPATVWVGVFAAGERRSPACRVPAHVSVPAVHCTKLSEDGGRTASLACAHKYISRSAHDEMVLRLHSGSCQIDPISV